MISSTTDSKVSTSTTRSNDTLRTPPSKVSLIVQTAAQILLENDWDGKTMKGFNRKGTFLNGHGAFFDEKLLDQIKEEFFKLKAAQGQVDPVASSPVIQEVNVASFKSILKTILRKTHSRNSTYFLGSTGVGKTTLIDYLRGAAQYELVSDDLDGYKLVRKEEKQNLTTQVDDTEGTSTPPPQNATSSSQSQTLYVEHYKYKEGKDEFLFSDCPGFQENRGKETRMAQNIALTRLFKPTNNLRSIVVVLKASDFIQTKSINLGDICEALNDLIQDPTKIVDSIFFVISGRETQDEKIFLTEETLLQYIKGKLLEEALKANRSSMVKVLNLINEKNLFFANYQPNSNFRENLLKKIKEAPRIPAQSFYCKLSGDRRQEIELFFNAYFKKVIELNRARKSFKARKEMCEEILLSEQIVKENNEKKIPELQKENFEVVQYSREGKIELLTAAIDGALRKVMNRIKIVENQIAEKNRKIKQIQEIDLFDEQGNHNRKCINTLKIERTELRNKLRDLDKSDLVELWQNSINEELWGKLLKGPIELLKGCSPFQSIYRFVYEGKPYREVEIIHPNNENHTLKIINEDKENGKYEAEYSVKRRADELIPLRNCKVIIKGEKRVAFQETIIELTALISELSTQINANKSQIENTTKLINELNKNKKVLEQDKLFIENQKDNIEKAGKEEFDLSQQKLKENFDNRKAAEIKFCLETILSTSLTIEDMKSKIESADAELAKLHELRKKERILYLSKNIKFFKKICREIRYKPVFLQLSRVQPVTSAPSHLLCAITRMLMVNPVRHDTCKAAFEESLIENWLKKLIAAKKNSTCPGCGENNVKRENFIKDDSLKAEIEKYKESLNRS